MKTIHLFVDFEFTSLSPDAQLISLGIVSEDMTLIRHLNNPDSVFNNTSTKHVVIDFEKSTVEYPGVKSFYAEFSDFDINRCDDWVKDNVVGKLRFNDKEFHTQLKDNILEVKNDTSEIKYAIKGWLEQFSDYQITFVVDCGTWDWYHLLQLLAIWDNVGIDDSSCPFCGDDGHYGMGWHEYKIGLPTLPINISPVPMDLNDLIAHKKGISVREAFDLNREELAFGFVGNVERIFKDEWHEQEMAIYGYPGEKNKNDKHNALFDCKVMKAIYEKLSV